MSQTALRKSLNLQPSTLSEVLKKVRKTQLVQVIPYGKSKLYSLSDTGIQYGRILSRESLPISGRQLNVVYSITAINNDQNSNFTFFKTISEYNIG